MEASAERRSHFKEIWDFVCQESGAKPFARMQGCSQKYCSEPAPTCEGRFPHLTPWH